MNEFPSSGNGTEEVRPPGFDRVAGRVKPNFTSTPAGFWEAWDKRRPRVDFHSCSCSLFGHPSIPNAKLLVTNSFWLWLQGDIWNPFISRMLWHPKTTYSLPFPNATQCPWATPHITGHKDRGTHCWQTFIINPEHKKSKRKRKAYHLIQVFNYPGQVWIR